jgi:hypothetical protein
VSVADQAAVDGVGELSFQVAQRFPVAFPGGAFALVVGATGVSWVIWVMAMMGRS